MIKIKHCIIVVVASMLHACTVLPGLDLSLGDVEGGPTELGGFDYQRVSLGSAIPADLKIDPEESDRALDSELDELLSKNGPDEYLVGPGDVLSIIVWDHPELTSPTGEFRDSASSGRLVDSRGYIFYPYIGDLKVSGITTAEIRKTIASKLSLVVRDPQVDVRVALFRSKKIKVLGEVNSPGVYSLTDVPTTVLDAVGQAGGVTQSGSVQHILLTRGGKTLTVSNYLQSRSIRSASDLILKAGDVLTIPKKTDYSIYLLGALGEQRMLPIEKGQSNLAFAISSVGGLDASTANSSKVFLIRSSSNSEGRGVRPVIYEIDLSTVGSLLLAKNINLRPEDIVYVDSTGFSSYNRVIAQILPTVTTLFQLDRLVRD